ncbi:LuxR C-terminal-related transcriptional regulator [Sphingobacterium hotanense]|uniref:LuxR C-terminal-related transcriptional regulator n=1 Tax=Sphingobacterium hotanense TaxID=649196 RepID=UPI0021A5CC93|nr:LuxR C-terminal-related transcriptional regulator [Sphingobacterium hotanense]MCT1523753.1 LuxR C-terminal-related transcriptional regulator [Sphingobacterium hotanense]
MSWKELVKSAESLLAELSEQGDRLFNENIALKLDSYFFILDCENTKILSFSEDFSRVLGYDTNSFTMEDFIAIIHPDDLPTFISHEKLALKFCLNTPLEKQTRFKIVHDYRIRKKSGSYIRVMQQTVAYELNDVCVLKTLIQHIDITTIKTSLECDLHFIDIKGLESVYHVKEENVLTPAPSFQLTKREIEILQLLDQAYKSEQIAEKLFISIHTVRTHRKNLLNKTECDNTIDLLKKVKALKLI